MLAAAAHHQPEGKQTPAPLRSLRVSVSSRRPEPLVAVLFSPPARHHFFPHTRLHFSLFLSRLFLYFSPHEAAAREKREAADPSVSLNVPAV